jgi:hypothetical protein
MGDPSRGIDDKILNHAQQQTANLCAFKLKPGDHTTTVLTELGQALLVDTTTGKVIEQTILDQTRTRLHQQEQSAKLEVYENQTHKAQRLSLATDETD